MSMIFPKQHHPTLVPTVTQTLLSYSLQIQMHKRKIPFAYPRQQHELCDSTQPLYGSLMVSECSLQSFKLRHSLRKGILPFADGSVCQTVCCFAGNISRKTLLGMLTDRSVMQHVYTFTVCASRCLNMSICITICSHTHSLCSHSQT